MDAFFLHAHTEVAQREKEEVERRNRLATQRTTDRFNETWWLTCMLMFLEPLMIPEEKDTEMVLTRSLGPGF